MSPQQLKEMEQHVDENAQPEGNVVSSIQWLVRMSLLSYYSAICIASTKFKRSKPFTKQSKIELHTKFQTINSHLVS